MIVHLVERNRFAIEHGDETAHLDYSRTGDTVNFTRTWTPPAMRGQGIAAQLVEFGVQWAQRENLRISASCSYVATWLERNPEALQ